MIQRKVIRKWEVVDNNKIYFIREETGVHQNIFVYGSKYLDGSGNDWDYAYSYSTARRHLLTDKRLKRLV